MHFIWRPNPLNLVYFAHTGKILKSQLPKKLLIEIYQILERTPDKNNFFILHTVTFFPQLIPQGNCAQVEMTGFSALLPVEFFHHLELMDAHFFGKRMKFETI